MSCQQLHSMFTDKDNNNKGFVMLSEFNLNYE